MSAQRFRTPRGLEWLKSLVDVRDENLAIAAMQRLFRLFATMWGEAVWEVVYADDSPTKFLFTDDPVTFFNPQTSPGAPVCRYPSDAISDMSARARFFLLHAIAFSSSRTYSWCVIPGAIR